VTEVAHRIAVDFTPLRRSRDFRKIWLGLLASELGWQFALVAVFIQTKELTNSAAAVGSVGLFWLFGLAIGTLLAGSVLDAYDRRSLLIVAQLGFSAASAVLLAGALAGDPPVALIYGATALTAAVSAVDGPTRSALTPQLVGDELIPSALALNQVIWNGTGLLGPAIAGIVIQRYGLVWAYAIDLATYGVMLVAALAIRPAPPERAEGPVTGWQAIAAGYSYVRRSRLLQSTFVIDLIAMIFGMPRALFPFLAVSQFDRGAEIIGLLFAAPAIGALVGAATGGWVSEVRRQGRATIYAVVTWGAAIAAFGLVGSHLVLAMTLLAVAGGADVISAIFRSTILQVSTPEHLRGRVLGIHILVVTGGPRLGDFEAGLVAASFSPMVSVVSGGLLCIAGAAICAFIYPELWRYRAGGSPRR
jgi:MFS family permease